MTEIVCDDVTGWTPIRDGDIYCSPRCGGRCKWVDYENAVAAANALCAMLGGKDEWKPSVWENLGWHYQAIRGNATVSYRGKRSDDDRRQPLFTAWVNTTIHSGRNGSNTLTFIAEHAEDPRAAVHDALKQWRTYLDGAEREYAALIAGTAPAGAVLSDSSAA